MTLLDYQQHICSTIAPALQPYGIEALPENAMDVDFSISEALASVGCCAIVLTPRLSFLGLDSAGDPAWEISELIIAIREHVPINRERPGAITALDAALLATEQLASDTITPVSINQREMAGELLCEAALQTSQFISSPIISQEDN